MFEAVRPGFAANELPDVRIEIAEFFLDFEKSAGILNGSVYFEFIANNPLIIQEFLNFGFIVCSYFFGIEIIKSFALMFSLSKNRYPTHSSLRTFKDEHFKRL